MLDASGQPVSGRALLSRHATGPLAHRYSTHVFGEDGWLWITHAHDDDVMLLQVGVVRENGGRFCTSAQSIQSLTQRRNARSVPSKTSPSAFIASY